VLVLRRSEIYIEKPFPSHMSFRTTILVSALLAKLVSPLSENTTKLHALEPQLPPAIEVNNEVNDLETRLHDNSQNSSFSLGRPEGRSGIGFRLMNDNSILFNEKLIPIAPDNKGDDYGMTHGYEISFYHDLPNEFYFTLLMGSNLYTRLISEQELEDGKTLSQQQFVNEEYIGIRIDTNQSQNNFHSTFDIGMHLFQNTTSDRFYQASHLQQLWHHAISDSVDIQLPENIQGEYYMLGLYAGFHQDYCYVLGTIGPFSLSARAEAGLLLSTIQDASSLDTSGILSLEYTAPSDKFGAQLDLEGKTLFHVNGVSPSLSATLTLGNEYVVFTGSIIQDFGTRPTQTLYDDKNGNTYDLKHFVGIQFFL
jgi:hypothetical protein